MKWVAIGSIASLIGLAMESLRQQVKANLTDECGLCCSLLDGSE